MIWNFILGLILIALSIVGFVFVNPQYSTWENQTMYNSYIHAGYNISTPPSNSMGCLISNDCDTFGESIYKIFPMFVEFAFILIGVAVIYASCRPVVM